VVLSILNTNPQSDKALPEGPSNGGKKADDHGHTGTDAPSFTDRVAPDMTVSLKQTGMVWDTKGLPYRASDKVYTATAAEPEIAGFTDGVYDDPATGASMPYHIYLPKNYDKGDKFPLIVFIPDASVNTDDTKLSLVQGNGGNHLGIGGRTGEASCDCTGIPLSTDADSVYRNDDYRCESVDKRAHIGL